MLWADEKVFRLRQCAGGNQNWRAWVHEGAARAEVPLELIRCGEGSFQGGVAATCCLGVSRLGVGDPRFMQRGKRMWMCFRTPAQWILWASLGRTPYTFQRGGASRHTSRLSQLWRAENLRSCWPKDARPPCSPDLNPLDSCVWGWVQGRVN